MSRVLFIIGILCLRVERCSLSIYLYEMEKAQAPVSFSSSSAPTTQATLDQLLTKCWWNSYRSRPCVGAKAPEVNITNTSYLPLSLVTTIHIEHIFLTCLFDARLYKTSRYYCFTVTLLSVYYVILYYYFLSTHTIIINDSQSLTIITSVTVLHFRCCHNCKCNWMCQRVIKEHYMSRLNPIKFIFTERSFVNTFCLSPQVLIKSTQFRWLLHRKKRAEFYLLRSQFVWKSISWRLATP